MGWFGRRWRGYGRRVNPPNPPFAEGGLFVGLPPGFPFILSRWQDGGKMGGMMLDGRVLFVPAGVLLVAVGRLDEARLIEGFAR